MAKKLMWARGWPHAVSRFIRLADRSAGKLLKWQQADADTVM
jgi:hypothetical protein